jgi:hypothetical protein
MHNERKDNPRIGWNYNTTQQGYEQGKEDAGERILRPVQLSICINHDKKIHDLKCLPDITGAIKSTRMRQVQDVAHILTEEERNAHMLLVGKPEEKKLLGRPKHRSRNNIKMYLKEMACRAQTGFSLLRIGTSGCRCFIKCQNFLTS